MSIALLPEYKDKFLTATISGDDEIKAHLAMFKEISKKLGIKRKILKNASKIAIDFWVKYKRN